MKFILLNGPSCAGKSTVARQVIDSRAHLFYLSYDTLKWSFSLYSHLVHGKDIHVLMNTVAETISAMGYDIICDSGLHKGGREALFEIPKKYGYEIVEVNIEADYDVLIRRFNERVLDARTNPRMKISNTSPVRFRELFDTYHKEKNQNAVTLRSDTQTAEEIAHVVLGLL